MSFRNSDPPARYKTSRITTLIADTEANNKMGGQLVNEADELLIEAGNAYEMLQDLQGGLNDRNDEYNNRLESDATAIHANYELVNNASQHAVMLEQLAQRFEDALASYKSPGSRTLEAARAYESIVAAVNEARRSGNAGAEAADEASSMVSIKSKLEQ